MSYLNSVTLGGFVGADPEQRQARNKGSKFTVLSVATQRSWKTAEDEWAFKTEWHRVCIFRPRLAEHVATVIKKGTHVVVEGELVSSTYESLNGKSKKSATTKITSWCIPLRANICETVLVLLINEQGEKEKGRDEREFSWCCSFPGAFGWRGTERRRAWRAAA